MEIKDILKQHTDAVELQMTALNADVKQALEDAGFVKGVVADLEKKLARLPDNFGTDGEPETPGAQFVGSDDAKAFMESAVSGKRVSVEVKTITTGSTSGGPLTTPFRDAPTMIAQRPLRVRDLLTVIPVSSGSVEYPKQTTRTNNAATVAEGAEKPESDSAFSLQTVPIRTIAHWILASRQLLDDAPQMRATIDNELLYQHGFVEDAQLLAGGGTGTDLSGIYTNATTFAAGSLVVASPTKIDAIGAALLQNALANIPATGIVLHPADWMGICLTKDSAGNYIIADPQDVTAQRLFGIPVVQTIGMTAGNFLVGDFKGSATLYDRQRAIVEASSEDAENFRYNLITLRAEERVGLAVKNALGFTKGAFATAITDLTS